MFRPSFMQRAVQSSKQAKSSIKQAAWETTYLICKTSTNTARYIPKSRRQRYYKCAALPSSLFLRRISLSLKLFSSSLLSLTGVLNFFPASSPLIASSNRALPSRSVSPMTLVLTVAPSRLFFPSRLLEAIFSTKSHNLPVARRLPFSSLPGHHSGARRIRGGTRGSLDRTTWMMPSSSKRWYEFLRVSLLTDSK
jgi:hypothetical protein